MFCRLAILAATLCGALQAEVILSGAGSTCRFLEQHKAELESHSGQQLRIKAKSSLRGLNDLLSSSANLAVITAPPKDFYRDNGLDERLTREFFETEICRGKAAFVANPANKISALTKDELRAIYTGRVTNWKDLGGADIPILVFCFDKTVGVGLVLHNDLDIDTLATGTFMRSQSSELVYAVANYAGAIGIVSAWDVDSRLKVMNDSALTFPVVIVSLSTPTVEEAKVIEAVKALLRESSTVK
jgi:phosphate transport system substrate-binding protein